MSPDQEPGISGAILSILNDPIAALVLARQIDRDEGNGTTTNLQEAAIRAINAALFTEEPHAVFPTQKAS